MIRTFRNKKLSVLIVAAIALLLVLVCMLLITLAQMSSLDQNAKWLQAEIEAKCQQKVDLEALKEYMQSDEYVKLWAENNDRMSQNDILWIIVDQLDNN